MPNIASTRDIGTVIYGRLSDDQDRRSREELTLDAGTTVRSGQILSQGGGGAGTVKPWAVGENFLGIAIYDNDATAAAKPIAVYVREFSMLKEGLLKIAQEDIPTATQAQIDAMIATITPDAGVIVRDAIDP